jgi:hypothetical protein
MKDAILLGAIMILVAAAIMSIGAIGDYAMRYQSAVIKERECKK